MVTLVGCGRQKSVRPAQARRLYTGGLFRLAAAWAERHARRWFILSAKHGLVEPDQFLAPYDAYLPALSPSERAALNKGVADRLRALVPPTETIVLLAGAEYAAFAPLVPHQVVQPLKGLPLGKRMAWLRRQLKRSAA